MKTQILFSIFTVLCLFVQSCRQNDPVNNREENTIKVKTVKVENVKTSFPIKCSGKITSKTEIKLSFKTGGIINEIFVDEGMSVKKNQVMAQLDLSEIEAIVNQARLGYEKSERDLHRAENLYADSVVTLEQLQNARTAVSLAKSQLRVAEFNKDHSVIKAPANGKILKKLGEKNETIGAGYPLFLFSSSESDWVFRTYLADVDIVTIKFNDLATIELDAFPGETFDAKVAEIAKAADPYTGTYEVELQLQSANPRFISGLIGRASIIPALKKEYQALPIKVLHDAEGMSGFVYLASDSTYEKRQIDIMKITDSLIYFKSTIDTSDLIIAEGAEYLTPGTILEIVEQ
jgi:membrane fusion protein, multidrug efflux system